MAASSLMVPLGSQAPDFTLPHNTGTMTGRRDLPARHIETALGTLLSHYPELAVVGICTNDADAYPGDRPQELAGQARRAGWRFSYPVGAAARGRPAAPAGPFRTWSTPTRGLAAPTTPPARQTSSSTTAHAGWPTAVRSTNPHPVTASRSPASCSACPSTHPSPA